MENWVRVLLIGYIMTLIDAQYVATSAGVCRDKRSTHVDKETAIFDCLKKKYNHSLTLNRNTEVRISYEIRDIVHSSSGFYLSGRLVLEWHDENFVWSERNLSLIISKKTVGLWKPEIFNNLKSNVETDKRVFRVPIVGDQTSGSVKISNKGDIVYIAERTLLATCPHENLKFFPYDVQTCQIELFTFQNVTFKTYEELRYYYLDPSTLANTSYKILEYTMTSARGQGDTTGGNVSSVFIRVKFARYDLMYWIKLYAPNLALCLFLLVPFCVPPAHQLRLLLPTIAFLALLRQMQTLVSLMPQHRVYTGDILMLDLYRNLLILSLIMLVHNFFSCLLWRKKAFLPAFLNHLYARLYKMEFCRKLTEVEAYFELEKQGTSEESPDNLEAAFHTWCELLRLLDILLFSLVAGVEAYSFVPTLDTSVLSR